MKSLRKTKIVVTIGPASENKLEELLEINRWYEQNFNKKEV